jgi:hypothetical protein
MMIEWVMEEPSFRPEQREILVEAKLVAWISTAALAFLMHLNRSSIINMITQNPISYVVDINPDMAVIVSPSIFQQATEAVEYLRMSLPPPLRNPRVGIICGSGLGGLADTIHPEPKHEVAYVDVPHFPKSTGMSIGTMICGNIWFSLEEEAKRSVAYYNFVPL